MQPHDTTQDIPHGYCQCGCGQLAPVAKRTNKQFGHTKGQPVRFIVGHFAKIQNRTPEERFWEKVNRCRPVHPVLGTRCWIWTGYTRNNGYGRIFCNGKNMMVHRFSYLLHYSKLPEDMLVCHDCDNPSCVNPRHLFIGSSQDNSSDMAQKGRAAHPEGQLHGVSKLTDADVRNIRERYASGETQRSIARDFNVHQSNISVVVSLRGWKHIK